jgi:aminopeptidase N
MEKDVKLLLFFILSFYATACHGVEVTANYLLDIKFNTDSQSMEGVATVTFPAGKAWNLNTHGLQVHAITTQEDGKQAIALPVPSGETISMYASKLAQQVTVHYSLQTEPQNFNNRISADGIALTSSWHPVPDRSMFFSLTANLPSGFKGISESDTIDIKQDKNILQTSFSQAVQTIHLAAGPYQIRQQQIRDGLSLSTWFFAEDIDLSDGYLAAAQEYIHRYEREIGPFPYQHYAIVANRLPTGYGMPTFTLLGQMVLRLPFIKETSLGHEILHSWFGNSIEIKEDSGNWCEGLTSYLADFSYATDKGEGAAHRKNSLLNYQSYVHPDSAIAMKDFRYASHNQPMAKAIRAVGYNRSAMFFHQLRGILGPEDFMLGIRLFVTTHKGKNASWSDLQTAFETVSRHDVSSIFSEQLTRTDVPSLAVTDIHTENRQDISILSFTLQQNTKKPYSLQVPIRIQTVTGTQTVSRTINAQATRINITLDQPPLSFIIDPEYDIFRSIDSHEQPPIWSHFLGSEHKLLVTDAKDAVTFAPLLQWAKRQGWPTISSDKITNLQLAEHSILFTNSENAAYKSLFGSAAPKKPGFNLHVKTNPLNEKEVMVLISSNGAQETRASLRKLSHYGKYSSLAFIKGRSHERTIATSENGLEYILEPLPMGGSTKPIKSFNDIITELATKQVIYLGETHDSLADHLLQLQIIQALQKKGLHLTLAMEMFPVSSQQALDQYILEKSTNEATFLRDSHWFKVWRYDWRLFRPIFNFCRKVNIPVHGINVDRKIVSTVFTSGHTGDLSTEQQDAIAQQRDLDLHGYVDRLRTVHGLHNQSPHGKEKSFAGFVQSQAIWDESMAENIVEILQEHPDTTVIVIAGSQHTRKDSGIPPRVLRRKPVQQASVINLYADNAPTDPSIEADYFFMVAPSFLLPKGKIGVMLSPEKDTNEVEFLRISDLSHAGKAKEAGIQKDDIILSISGEAIKNMEDIGIVMMNSRAGDKLPMTISRTQEGEDEPKEIKIEVELSDLSKPTGHP